MPTTGEIAQHVQGQLVGPADIFIRSMDAIHAAGPEQICFIRDGSHAGQWASSKAAAAIIGPKVNVEPGQGRALIKVADADLAVARLLELMAPKPPRPEMGIHPNAVVSRHAKIGSNVSIGPFCVIGSHVTVGDGCILHSNVTLMDETTLGSECEIFPGVIIRERCILGDRCILHPNVVIGADGFGFRPSADGKSIVKIPQIGIVHIGSDVEIGANTCVDRAKFSETRIGDFTKIDNLCQIGHNCVIGRGCMIAGQTGLCGSVTLGDGVVIGGQTGISDQLTIGSGAMIGGCSVVTKDVPAKAAWNGVPAQDMRQSLRQIAAVRKLPDVLKSWRQEQKQNPNA